MQMVLFGTTPILAQAGPVCLAAHPSDVQACSSPARDAVPRLSRSIETPPGPNESPTSTPPVVLFRGVYADHREHEVYDASGTHISGVWADYLQNVVLKALRLPLPPSR